MEGKEARFGIWSSTLFASATTGTSTGAVNSMHDSYTALGGMMPLVNMMLGEVAPGGVGTGLYGMLILAVIAVFVGGLLIGRTPEYLGKRIGPREITLASLYILVTPALVLGGTALSFAIPAIRDDVTTTSIWNPGVHGMTEVLYAFTSAANNNGSAFAGLTANTPWFNTALGVAMLLGRFVPIVFALALAGSLAAQEKVPTTVGTLPTHRPQFVGLLSVVAVVVTALTYFPGVLRSLDQDQALTLRARGQLVNGRYIPVKTVAEARAVADILTGEDRLPLALIHVRSTDTWDLARELSRKLLGLVRTVTLNFETSRVVAESHPEVRVPFGGLAIAWPGLGAPPLPLSAERLSDLGVEEIRRVLTQRLGALAALGNGEDTAWRRVRSLAENARLAELSEQASRAREGGDKDGEISALQQQVEALEVAKAELEVIGEDALQQAETSARLARQLESERNQAREEAEMWQTSYRDLSAGKSMDAPAPRDAWSEIPELVPRTDPEATFLAITDAASEHIVFTDRARKSWADIDYPEPADMTEKLVALARAAVALYDGEEKSIPLLDDWLKEQFGLTVALTDQTITKWKRKEMRWLNEFEFEDETLNAAPHVKVRDAVKFNECGRIHFALEGKKGRLVVQHVGVKTYQ